MRVIVVDDERDAIEALERELLNTPGIADIQCFDDPVNALGFVGETPCDIAFLDIEMYGISGLALAKRIKETRPQCNIVFVTGHAQYAVDAFKLSASDYLLKPVDGASIRRAMDNLRHPANNSAVSRFYVRCFGNFEVFLNGKPLVFERSKSKELFAYLISRQGAFCSNNEIVAQIWEDREDSPALQSQFRTLVSDLTQTLRACGLEDVLLRKRGGLAAVPDKVGCDLYEFLKGDSFAVNRYTGEFMTQYSWAEFTNGYLSQKV